MLELYHNTNNYLVEFRHSFLLNCRKKHRLYNNSVTLPVDLTLHSCKNNVSMIRKYHIHTNSTLRISHSHNSHRTQEDKQSKATSSLFPIKMIAKLLRTKSNAQQNMDTRDHRMGATINNESPDIEPSHKRTLSDCSISHRVGT